MLSVDNVSVTYGKSISAARDVSLDVGDGEVVAVLGANGAGKTTLMRAVSNTLGHHGGRIVGGSITFDGEEISRASSAAIVRRGLVQSPEGRQVFGRMSVDENLRVAAAGARTPRGAARHARQRVLDLFPALVAKLNVRAGLMSGGEQQMLAIGRALMACPRLLLLDEPSLGLSPRMMSTIGHVVRQIHAQGTAVLIVEQNAAMALALSQRAIVLETGTVSLTGPSSQLAGDPAVQKLYLGSDERVSVTLSPQPAEPAPAGGGDQ